MGLFVGLIERSSTLFPKVVRFWRKKIVCISLSEEPQKKKNRFISTVRSMRPNPNPNYNSIPPTAIPYVPAGAFSGGIPAKKKKKKCFEKRSTVLNYLLRSR